MTAFATSDIVHMAADVEGSQTMQLFHSIMLEGRHVIVSIMAEQDNGKERGSVASSERHCE